MRISSSESQPARLASAISASFSFTSQVALKESTLGRVRLAPAGQVTSVPLAVTNAAVPDTSNVAGQRMGSDEHKSELQSIMCASYPVLCSNKKIYIENMSEHH